MQSEVREKRRFHQLRIEERNYHQNNSHQEATIKTLMIINTVRTIYPNNDFSDIIETQWAS